MKRIYDALIKHHLKNDNEMLFLSGPRQVGKTTSCQQAQNLSDQSLYLNWDIEEHRHLILSGLSSLGLDRLSLQQPIIIFDEIHKHPDWKNFLKGFYDAYGKKMHIIVSGSARLDIYQKGGDSLMGRYFPYRMHPISVGECLRTTLRSTEISSPTEILEADFNALWNFGGFPKPFLKREKSFHIRWQNLRKQQLIQEDIRDINVIHNLKQLQLLMELITQQAAQQITYTNLAKHTRISVDTVTRWLDVLETFFYCYRIRPWSANISRSLLKEPKLFLWDWSTIQDAGARAENFVAAHLLKAVHHWTDRGLGLYDLHYIRTTEKKEVDFLVTKNHQAWFLVEVKLNNNQPISPHLIEFQKQTGAEHAFQVVIQAPYIHKSCFESNAPIIVPAKTFLSQLV